MIRPPSEGVAMLLTLVLLVALSILALSAVQDTSVQQRMAIGAVDGEMAFMAAEAGLLQAERFIEEAVNSPALFTAAGAEAAGLYLAAAPGDAPAWRRVTWNGDAGFRQAPRARYIVEYLGARDAGVERLNLGNIGDGAGEMPVHLFRVTVRGLGPRPGTRAVVQSIYAKRM